MNRTSCGTCFMKCSPAEGQSGRCGGRVNTGGRIGCGNYGRITSLALDPIEKKPLAEFYPGSMILSCGSYGCNLDCPFCQNYEISRADEDSVLWTCLSPAELAEQAELLKSRGNIGLAFTYNEPLIGWEYVRDTARLVHERGMKNAVVTNGSVNQAVLEEILPYIDAFNVDLKSFTEDGYRKLGGDLETVKQFIKTAAGSAHVEITSLIVPGLNDSPEEMEAMCSWIADIDRKIPLHITRFFPTWRMTDRDPTDTGLMKKLQAVARRQLGSVYLGNV